MWHQVQMDFSDGGNCRKAGSLDWQNAGKMPVSWTQGSELPVNIVRVLQWPWFNKESASGCPFPVWYSILYEDTLPFLLDMELSMMYICLSCHQSWSVCHYIHKLGHLLPLSVQRLHLLSSVGPPWWLHLSTQISRREHLTSHHHPSHCSTTGS